MTEALIAARQYIGRPVAELVEACSKSGWIVRVRRENGKTYIGTCDFRPNRINVSVDAGLVSEIGGIG